eukprot:TRINITY_DN4561_c6_g1_i1.p1 TRINITY_DN4561_c6_g1~~TRINITY_DN4561_c6_g1_i1.p1  ORF type:complete len:239 (+),score=43.44 TRINITY_DN4561_c6_g1_i1:47-763(+)
MQTVLALFSGVAAVSAYKVLVVEYSDAQCPCSAQFQSDILKNVLKAPGFEDVDFQQYFVGGYDDKPGTCIHGKEECVGQKYFLCAWHMAGMGTYRESPKGLDFQHCSYGTCTSCPAIEGPHCPCTNYTTFPKWQKNDVMKNCAAQTGLDWTTLQDCANGPLGETLLEQSANISIKNGIHYGAQGIPVVHIKSNTTDIHVKTKEPEPIVCGPTPKEVMADLCKVMKQENISLPASCPSE